MAATRSKQAECTLQVEELCGSELSPAAKVEPRLAGLGAAPLRFLQPRPPLLQEAAEGGHACAGPHHDPGAGEVAGDAEGAAGADVDGDAGRLRAEATSRSEP